MRSRISAFTWRMSCFVAMRRCPTSTPSPSNGRCAMRPSFRDSTKIRMVYECDGQQLAIARHAASRCFLHDMTSYLQVRKRRRPSIATVCLRSVGGVKVGCTHPVCLAEWWSRLPNTRSSACSITPSVSRINRFERKPVSFFLQKETPPRERDSVD